MYAIAISLTGRWCESNPVSLSSQPARYDSERRQV